MMMLAMTYDGVDDDDDDDDGFSSFSFHVSEASEYMARQACGHTRELKAARF